MTWLAILFALASAFTTALSTSVQHLAAGQAPDSVARLFHLLWHLTQRPVWLFGQMLGFAGFTFHALAVINGPISLVQPIIITGIVFAVPIRAAISRRLPEAREMAAVGLTAVALAVFLVASNPSHGSGRPDEPVFALLVGGCALLGVLVFLTGRRVGGDTQRAFLLGGGAGLLLGLVAVLVKASEQEFNSGGLTQVLASWPFYGVMVVGLTGVAINQVAYRSARLSASMPVLNVVNVLLALSFGYLVFSEIPRHSPGVVVVELVSLAVMCVGLWVLANYEEAHLDEIAEAIPHPRDSSDVTVSGDDVLR